MEHLDIKGQRVEPGSFYFNPFGSLFLLADPDIPGGTVPRHILLRVGERRTQEDLEQDLHDPQG